VCDGGVRDERVGGGGVAGEYGRGAEGETEEGHVSGIDNGRVRDGDVEERGVL